MRVESEDFLAFKFEQTSSIASLNATIDDCMEGVLGDPERSQDQKLERSEPTQNRPGSSLPASDL